MDELLLKRTVFVLLLSPVVDLIAGVDTKIRVVDTATNVIINIFGVLSNVKG